MKTLKQLEAELKAAKEREAKKAEIQAAKDKLNKLYGKGAKKNEGKKQSR